MAKHFPNGFNQLWAEKVHHLLRQQKDTVSGNFRNFKMKMDGDLQIQADANQSYLNERYTLTRLWQQISQFLEEAERFVCQFGCFIKSSHNRGDGQPNRHGNGNINPSVNNPDTPGRTDHKRGKRGRGQSKQSPNSHEAPAHKAVKKEPNCRKCGNYHKNLKHPCGYETKHHPDINTDPNTPWDESTVGKRYKTHGKTSLAWNQALDGTSLNWPTTNPKGTLAATTRADIQPLTSLTSLTSLTLSHRIHLENIFQWLRTYM